MSSDAGLERCIEILGTLVAFATVSDRPNRALIDWIADFLQRLEIASTVVPAPDAGKANLFATLGPAGAGGILLSGHSDVVPTDGQPWSVAPFALTRRGDRLYGRGTTDMKGFIACALTVFERHRGTALRTPLHLAVSYDEELGCLGIPGLIERFGRDLPMPRIAVVGEPSRLRPVNAHKGFRAFRTHFRGEAGHSSRPDLHLSALRLAAAFLQALERLGEELAAAPPGLAAGMEPPHTTINAGRILGGQAINIVPQDCVLEWEFRPAPGDDPEAIVDRLDALYAAALPRDLAERGGRARTETEALAAEPLFNPEPEGLAERLITALIGSNRCEAAAYGTEAGFFQSAGISTILIGPGDIAQAHQPDEFVECEQLEQTLTLLDAMVRWAAGNELAAP